MVKLRKLLAIIYFLVFATLMIGLIFHWFAIEPVASFMEENREQAWFSYYLLISAGISLVGALVLLIRALMLRSKKSFQRSFNELGILQISRATMIREVNNVLDAHPEVKRLKTNVVIKNRRNPYVKAEIRVAPRGSLDMPEVAATLQREVKATLERLTGNEVRSVLVDVRRGSSGDDYEPENVPAQAVEEPVAQIDEVEGDVEWSDEELVEEAADSDWQDEAAIDYDEPVVDETDIDEAVVDETEIEEGVELIEDVDDVEVLDVVEAQDGVDTGEAQDSVGVDEAQEYIDVEEETDSFTSDVIDDADLVEAEEDNVESISNEEEGAVLESSECEAVAEDDTDNPTE